jgi:Arc/MetJ family transcription regulator
MRTTLDLPDGLIEEARRAANLPSKRAAVVAGLEELIRRARREALRGLAGKLDVKVDLNRSRKRSA